MYNVDEKTKKIEQLKVRNKRTNIWIKVFVGILSISIIFSLISFLVFHQIPFALGSLAISFLSFTILGSLCDIDMNEQAKLYMLTGSSDYKMRYFDYLKCILENELMVNGNEPKQIIFSFEKVVEAGMSLIEIAHEHNWEYGIDKYKDACELITQESQRNKKVNNTLKKLQEV